MRDINLTKIVKDYLKYLKIKKKVFYKIRSCEICGSKKNTIIQEKISWNRSKYGTFPVVACNFCGFLLSFQ